MKAAANEPSNSVIWLAWSRSRAFCFFQARGRSASAVTGVKAPSGMPSANRDGVVPMSEFPTRLMGVEEAQWASWFADASSQRLTFPSFGGHGVEVDAVDAGRDDVAGCCAGDLDGGFGFVGSNACEPVPRFVWAAATRKRPDPQGRIPQREQRLLSLDKRVFYSVPARGAVQCGVEDEVDEACGCVVGRWFCVRSRQRRRG